MGLEISRNITNKGCHNATNINALKLINRIIINQSNLFASVTLHSNKRGDDNVNTFISFGLIYMCNTLFYHIDIAADLCSTDNGGCSSFAECTNVHGRSVTCKCRTGFIGNGTVCKKPCDIKNGGCPPRARCVSEPLVSRCKSETNTARKAQ